MASPLVVLTDFYAVTNRALSYAAGLAVPLQAELVLLHARHDVLLAPVGHNSHSPLSDHTTDKALQTLAAEQPVPTQVEVSDRELPEAVRAAVRHHHPLLLVLGRPGGADTPVEIMTGTAMDLLTTVPYPLLVVPAPGWDDFPPRRLLLAVDGEPFTLLQHQDVLRQLLHVAAGTLAVVRVADDSHARLGAEAILRTVAANNLTDELPPSQLHEVHNHSVVGGVLAEAARQDADLLVVVARRHSLLGSLFHRSVTAQLLERSAIPVLVLPAED
ncbi:universal stress protein [Hymenobacter sp. H14-R3]|uniref:universal stress protein n=1 Tax=Hymenobacter sp. H14-R3 TaxID=3046308 RepID=UPI0024BBD564|nr:universal stress protein [Hymenobacter sp. H14-R3]MDJ0366513.1 universal stress protein [Hymenobacter sp. H14-R3]